MNVGNQPKPYGPPAPTVDTKIRCAACHVELLSPPIGMTAGLCPNLDCLRFEVLTPARLRDYSKVAGMVLSGLMTFEFEPETFITWLAQVPPKPAQRGTPIVMDDGSPRYRDWDNSAIIGGDSDASE